MDIVFLGGLYPEEFKKEIIFKSKGAIQYAADAHQWALVQGLDCVNDVPVSLINLPFVGDTPRYYSDYFIPSFHFSHIKGSADYNVGFFNLSIINSFTKYYAAYKALLNWSKIQKDKKIIIIYGLFPYFLIAATKQKRHNQNIKLCLVVPDLPEYMGGNNKKIHIKIFIKLINYLNQIAIKKIDAFVLLTDYMVEKIDIKNRPWIRIEGLLNEDFSESIVEKEKNITIFYSGNLNKSHGIIDLLDIFQTINKPNYRLWISGEGSEKNYIIQLAKDNKQIIYYNKLSKEELNALQKKATVLINLRKEDSPGIKYFFPSKIIEYMATGTPVISRKIPCIPNEYFQYLYCLESDSLIQNADEILSICERPRNELDSFGLKAKKFIIENKNSKVQCQKILDMLKNI